MAKRFKCTPEELEEFVKSYPRKLVSDVYGACEPPLVTYNDFTLGNWPESVVASYSAPYMPGDPETNHKIAKEPDGALQTSGGGK